VVGGSDGTLQCPKCNKKLKAIGVDYSKLDNVYNCQDCKALFSDINQQYLCLDCRKSSLLEESHVSLLHEYTIDVNKLSKIVDADNSAIMLSVIKELDKVGIKSSIRLQ
jgi:DNA-directed RNA polymerase subunit RPC12/RpoP